MSTSKQRDENTTYLVKVFVFSKTANGLRYLLVRRPPIYDLYGPLVKEILPVETVSLAVISCINSNLSFYSPDWDRLIDMGNDRIDYMGDENIIFYNFGYQIFSSDLIKKQFKEYLWLGFNESLTNLNLDEDKEALISLDFYLSQV
jgi:hypothetical protein